MNTKFMAALLITLVSASACKTAGFGGSGKKKDGPRAEIPQNPNPLPEEPTNLTGEKPVVPGPEQNNAGQNNAGQNNPDQNNSGQNGAGQSHPPGKPDDGKPHSDKPGTIVVIPGDPNSDCLASCDVVQPNHCVQPFLAKPLSNTDKIGSNQNGVRLYGGQDNDMNLRDFTLTRSCLSNSSLVRTKWEGVKLYTNEMILANFSFSNWNNSLIQNSDLRQGNWANSDLRNVQIIGSCLNQSNFGAAKFESVSLNGSRANNVVFGALEVSGTFHFKNGEAKGAIFDKAVFHGHVSFAYTKLNGAKFVDTKFESGVDLTGADLSGAVWTDGRTCSANSIGACR